MPRILKADFLQEEMVRIINIFASFTCLRHNNQDPDKVLWNLKTWIIKHFNKLILHTRFISKINFYREYGGLFLPTGVTSYVHWWDDEKVKEYIQAGVIFLSSFFFSFFHFYIMWLIVTFSFA